MAEKPALTSESIALTEKKMDMTLDDIIKMSKTSSSKTIRTRPSNKSHGSLIARASQGNSSKAQRYVDSRPSIRQGVLAQRRSNFQGAQFPLVKEAARKAAVAPIRNRFLRHNRVTNWNKPRVEVNPAQIVVESGFLGARRAQGQMVPKQRPQTLDSLFANMKEQRMRVLSQQQIRREQNGRRQGTNQQQQQQRLTVRAAGPYYSSY